MNTIKLCNGVGWSLFNTLDGKDLAISIGRPKTIRNFLIEMLAGQDPIIMNVKIAFDPSNKASVELRDLVNGLFVNVDVPAGLILTGRGKEK